MGSAEACRTSAPIKSNPYAARILVVFSLPLRSVVCRALVFGGLMVSGGAYAQDQTAMQAPQNPVVGQRFEDWTLRCVQPEADAAAKTPKAACELAQSVQVEQDGKRVEILNLAIARADDKAGKARWALVVLAPLDVHLPSDLGLGIGIAKPVLTRYRNCNGMGCFALVPLDDAQLNRLKRAKEGAVFFRLLNQRAVKVVFSLKGFSKAFADLEAGKMPVVETVHKPQQSDKKGKE